MSTQDNVPLLGVPVVPAYAGNYRFGPSVAAVSCPCETAAPNPATGCARWPPLSIRSEAGDGPPNRRVRSASADVLAREAVASGSYAKTITEAACQAAFLRCGHCPVALSQVIDELIPSLESEAWGFLGGGCPVALTHKPSHVPSGSMATLHIRAVRVTHV